MRRAVVTVAALAGLGTAVAAFAVGTSYGGGHRDIPVDGPEPIRVHPVSYAGSGFETTDGCAALLASYQQRGEDRVSAYGWNGGTFYPLREVAPNAAGSSDSARSDAPSTERATSSDTGTNVQEAGVDEPDVAKTDGDTLFRVQDGSLVTYDVSGPSVERLGSVDLPGLSAGEQLELLLSDSTVVVIGQHDERTDVLSVDVSEPAAPTVEHTAVYDAALVTARLQGGVVRLVVQGGLPDLDFVLPDRHRSEDAALRANRALVADTSITDWLPTVSLDGRDPEPVTSCDDVAVPTDLGTPDPLGTEVVLGFYPHTPEYASTTALALDSDLVYASTDELYLAVSGTSWGGGPVPLEGSVRSGTPDGRSRIYAFDLQGLDATYAAHGVVDGFIADRWSMDAVDGVLRVAVGPTQATGDFTSVLTLRRQGSDLVEAGRVDALGVGEQLKSVRWFDDLALLVTYRQTDPLYAVDLTSDQPRLIGELKVPGYSAYLHPLGAHRLLGLGAGQDGTDAWSASAGLFDVTDLTAPRRLATMGFGAGTVALATEDPRQLTWLPDQRTVLTVVADWNSRAGQTGYVAVLGLGGGRMSSRLVPVAYGDAVSGVRLLPLPDGRVVLSTPSRTSYFDVT
jgi:hypothetical protein